MAGEEEQHLRKPASASLPPPASASSSSTTSASGAKGARDAMSVEEALRGEAAVDADLEEVVDREVEAAAAAASTVVVEVVSPASSSSGASSASSPLPLEEEEESESGSQSASSAVSSPMERSNAGSHAHECGALLFSTLMFQFHHLLFFGSVTSRSW